MLTPNESLQRDALEHAAEFIRNVVQGINVRWPVSMLFWGTVGALILLGPLMLAGHAIFPLEAFYPGHGKTSLLGEIYGWSFLVGLFAPFLLAPRLILAHPEHTFVVVIHAGAMVVWFLLTGGIAVAVLGC